MTTTHLFVKRFIAITHMTHALNDGVYINVLAWTVNTSFVKVYIFIWQIVIMLFGEYRLKRNPW